MSVSPSHPSPTPNTPTDVAAGGTPLLTFGDRLHLFWEKNSNYVFALCGLILLVVILKGVWEYIGRQKELSIQNSYAAASTPEALKAFAGAHPQHTLAAIAQLRMADDAYAAGQFAEAATGYDQVLTVVSTGPLAARVRLGRAIAKTQSGDVVAGAAELKALVEDATQLRAIRVEAGYHLASLAADARDSEQTQKLSDQLLQIDPSSLWTQRALTLRMNLSTAAPATASPAVSAPVAPATAPAGDAAPSIQLNVPGK